MSTSLSDLEYFFTLEESSEKWQQQHLRGMALHPQLGKVATLSGYLIYRRQLVDGDFLLMMEEESHELQELATTLFDKDGRLKPRLKSGYRSGTGCWGDELNDDTLVYIEHITVKEEYRRQGIGSQLLQRLQWKDKYKMSNILCWPSTKDDATPDAFFAKNGFRRIGRTEFFGYSLNPQHPSHRILPSDDVQQSINESFPLAPQPSYHEMLAQGQSPYDISDNIKQERQQRYPLHCAIRSDKSISVAQLICSAHVADPRSLYAPDDVGILPMHVAVQDMNMIAFNTLIELGRLEDLQNYDNAHAATPLELLRDAMEDRREMVEMLSVYWPQQVNAVLSMEYAVKVVMGLDTGCATVEDYLAQENHGCSCGHCLDGWLSPRMIFQLQLQAELNVANMPLEGEYTFGTLEVVDASEVDYVFHGDYIPPSLYSNGFYLSFYEGFTAVFSAAYDVLQRKSSFTTETVRDRALHAYSDETTYFFKNGGKVEYALDLITSFAKSQSSFGDGEFFRTYGDDEEFVRLPHCANDIKFGLVRRMVGLDPEQQWGPYSQPDGMNEDR